MEANEFFEFSNPLFLDAFVAVVLYIICRVSATKFPRISEGIREASLIFIVFMCYDAARYFALDEEDDAKANARKVIEFEERTYINFEIPMQTFAVAHEYYAKFLNHFYLGAHWGGLVIFFVWAYARVIFASPNKMERRRKLYVQARGRFVIMNMIAACSFMAFPCAPPRVFPEEGFKDTLFSIGHTDVYSETRRWVNPYAAMPSMHQGYSLLFAVTIVIMLRSEILASAVVPDEEDNAELASVVEPDMKDDEIGKLANTSGLRAKLSRLVGRYEQYHLLSRATRSDEQKLYYISLLPFAFLVYPFFMFVVIVSTGNHFVLDALAGATAMGLAVLLFPPVLRVLMWARGLVNQASGALTQLSERIISEKLDIEMGGMQEGKESEKKGFLADPPAETA